MVQGCILRKAKGADNTHSSDNQHSLIHFRMDFLFFTDIFIQVLTYHAKWDGRLLHAKLIFYNFISDTEQLNTELQPRR